MKGDCESKNVVYKATVTSENKSETYSGLAGPSFKSRYRNQKSSFKTQKAQTTLASHIIGLQNAKKPYAVQWEFLKKCPPYNTTSQNCLLCLTEKYFILYKPEFSTLNSRSEFYSSCRHRKQFLLDNT